MIMMSGFTKCRGTRFGLGSRNTHIATMRVTLASLIVLGRVSMVSMLFAHRWSWVHRRWGLRFGEGVVPGMHCGLWLQHFAIKKMECWILAL